MLTNLPNDPAECVAVLIEDLDERWRSGDRYRVEGYFQQYPQLLDYRDGALELIYSEFLLERETTGVVNTTAYLLRFPEFFEELRSRFPVLLTFDQEGAELDTVYQSLSSSLAIEETLPFVSAPTDHGQYFGHYAIQRPLGEGGMGTVFLAHDSRIDREVALKIIRSDRDSVRIADLFFEEIRSMGKIDHPHICKVYHSDQRGSTPYMAMEYVEGGSLADWLDSQPNRRCETPDVAVELVRQAAEGIAVVHMAGLLHRDIKPANLMVDLVEHLKVSDFGLACRIGCKRSGRAGTPLYMAPEMKETGSWDREKVHQPRLDVYSLGLVLYELLMGKEQLRALGKRQSESRSPPTNEDFRAGLNSELIRILKKTLDPIPERRYQDAAQLADDLKRWLDNRPWGTFSPVPTPPSGSAKIPSGTALLFMMLCKPFSLRQRLLSLGIENPNISVWQAWRQSRQSTDTPLNATDSQSVSTGNAEPQDIFKKYKKSLRSVMWSYTFCGAFLTSGMILAFSDFSEEANVFDGLNRCIALAVAGIFCGSLFGLTKGVAWGATWAIAWGAFGVFAMDLLMPLFPFGIVTVNESFVSDGMFAGALLGFCGGLCVSICSPLSLGQPPKTWDMIFKTILVSAAFAAMFGHVVPVVCPHLKHLGITPPKIEPGFDGLRAGLCAAGALVVFGFLGATRLPLYAIEWAWASILYWAEILLDRSTLKYVPVMGHQLCVLPYPFLERHIREAVKNKEWKLADQALRCCELSWGQRKLAARLRPQLFGERLLWLSQNRQWERLAHWLAKTDAERPFQGSDRLANAARRILGANRACSEGERVEFFQQAEYEIQCLKRVASDNPGHIADMLMNIANEWEKGIRTPQSPDDHPQLALVA